MTALASPQELCQDDAASTLIDRTAIFFPDPQDQVLGERYRLLSRMAEGGMGTIYRAEHVVLHKRVAVKVLRPEHRFDEDLVRRFRQEAIAASEIRQENIVDVIDFGRTLEGSLYFVMEELEGGTLAALTRETGPLPAARAALILAQVCRALAAAHARGFVHRDLKPDNVVVLQREDGSDFVKLVDFGISRSASEAEGEAGSAVVGTPDYMAPEQVAGAAIDHRADIYAFGVLAYEIVTGRLPFGGETGAVDQLEHRGSASSRTPAPPSWHRPGLPPALEALILKALEQNPAARQQSMGEVADDLTRALAALGLPPVYDRTVRPPLALGPVRGFTAVFGAPAAPAPSSFPGGGTSPDRDSEPCIGSAAANQFPTSRPAASVAGSPRGRAHRPRRGTAAAAALVLAAAGAGFASWRAATPAARAPWAETATPSEPLASSASSAAGAPMIAVPTASVAVNMAAAPIARKGPNAVDAHKVAPPVKTAPTARAAPFAAATPAAKAVPAAKTAPAKLSREARTRRLASASATARGAPSGRVAEKPGGRDRVEKALVSQLDDLKPDPF